MWRSRRRTDRGLTCAEIVELVTEYLDGTLAPQQQAQVEEHLAGCEGCAEYLDQIGRTSALLRGAAAPHDGETITLSDDACDALTAAFRDWVGNRPDLDGRAGS